MEDPRLIKYIRTQLRRGHSAESIKRALLQRGFDPRTVERAVNEAVQAMPAQILKLPKPKVPAKALAVTGIVVIACMAIFILLLNQPPAGALKIKGYTFECDGPYSNLSIHVRNAGRETENNLQLFMNGALQSVEKIPSLEPGKESAFRYTNINCRDWLEPRTINVTSDRASNRKTFTFQCTTGTC